MKLIDRCGDTDFEQHGPKALETHIVQLLPVPHGWRAVYWTEDENKVLDLEIEPLLAIALVEDCQQGDRALEIDQKFLPITIGPSGVTGAWESEDQMAYLVGYLAPGQEPGDKERIEAKEMQITFRKRQEAFNKKHNEKIA